MSHRLVDFFFLCLIVFLPLSLVLIVLAGLTWCLPEALNFGVRHVSLADFDVGNIFPWLWLSARSVTLKFGPFNDLRSPDWAQILFRISGYTGLIEISTVPSLGELIFFGFFIYCLTLICFTYKYSSHAFRLTMWSVNVPRVILMLPMSKILWLPTLFPSLHSASPAGITLLNTSCTNPSQFSMDVNSNIVQPYDRSTDKTLRSLKGHTKKINYEILSRSPHKLYLRSPLSTKHTLYLIFNQISRLTPSDAAFTSLAIHPDGTLLALGTPTSTKQIYDVQ